MSSYKSFLLKNTLLRRNVFDSSIISQLSNYFTISIFYIKQRPIFKHINIFGEVILENSEILLNRNTDVLGKTHLLPFLSSLPFIEQSYLAHWYIHYQYGEILKGLEKNITVFTIIKIMFDEKRNSICSSSS